MKRYLLLVIPLLILISMCLYGLDQQYMWSDEVYSFHAAEMIQEKGEPIYDSGLNYARSPIYHQLLAISMKIFGNNELGSRIINIPFWLGTTFIIFLFLKDFLTFIKGERRPLLALTVSLFYLISNFSIAMLRETRMYGMSTFLFVLSAHFLYKAIINVNKKYSVEILKIYIDWRYSLAFIASFLTAYNTQPINILLGLGLLTYFFISGVLQRNVRYILISGLIGIFGVLLAYLRYNTLNIFSIFIELSPSWAENSSILYYSILTVRNLPFVLCSAPLAVYMILKKKSIEITYLSSIILGFLIFLSLQEAQHERYWQAVVPLIILVSFYSFVLLLKDIRSRTMQKIFLATLLLFSIFHIYLSTKEITEIQTYTPTSLSIHKKLQYNSLEKDLKENMKEGDILIADFHSAYTLYQKGFNIQYLLLADNDVNWSWKDKDLYFDIPLISYDQLQTVFDEKDGYLVIRDSEQFRNFTNTTKIIGYLRPLLYKF